MARFLSQTLIRDSQALARYSSHPALAARFISLRGRSKRPEKVQLIELDLGAAPAEEEEPEPGSGKRPPTEIEAALGMRRLKDAIHAIVIRRAAPDWIPFVPGTSYWIPPARKATPMTEEEELSFSSPRGWPSFSYFVEGALPNKVYNSPEMVGCNLEVSPKSDDEDDGIPSTDMTNGPSTL